jgi:hypothetical protein
VIEARVSENFMADGIDIWIRMSYDGGRRMLHFRDGQAQWDEIDGSEQGPTLTIPDDAGRSLLEQLMRHYSGAQDLHTVRSDLLHERGRVDQLIRTVSELAGRAVGR